MFNDAVLGGNVKVPKRLYKKLIEQAEDVPLYWSLWTYDKESDGYYQSFLDGIQQGYVSGYLAARNDAKK